MQTILKGYILRLYPTDEQRKLINKTIGCTRFSSKFHKLRIDNHLLIY